MKKSQKWAYVAISCCLLASLVRACAPKYDATQAQPTNNQVPAYNYSEYFENIDENIDKLTGVEEIKGLNK